MHGCSAVTPILTEAVGRTGGGNLPCCCTRKFHNVTPVASPSELWIFRSGRKTRSIRKWWVTTGMAKPRRRDRLGSLVMRSRSGFLSRAAVVVVASLMLANSGRAFAMEQTLASENASTHSPNDFGTVVSEDGNGDLVIASDSPLTVTQESTLSPLEIVEIVSDDRDRGSTLQYSDDLLS